VSTDQGVFEGNLLVGADGVHSVFHRDLGLRTRPHGRRVGISTHLTGFAASPDRVEVVCFEGGEAYIAPVEDGLTLVALLVDQRLGLRSSDVLSFVGQLLPDRAVGTRLATPVLGSSPLAYSVDRIAGENWMLVGDSAGRIDPISGEGISVALTSGVMAAEAAERALSGEGSLQDYETAVRDFRRPLEQVTSLLIYMSRHPQLARRFVGLGPERLSVLMRIATGMEGFSWPGLVRSVLAPGSKRRRPSTRVDAHLVHRAFPRGNSPGKHSICPHSDPNWFM
jgi:flavin-dependent dehydrogenase